MIRYIADLHFDDEDIIAYDNRPFHDVDEMNEAMIEGWNRTVADSEDLTWILGDFCAGDAGRWISILQRLKGRKAMILGNHDNPDAAKAAQEMGLLEDAADYREITDQAGKVILCHYPIVPFHDHYFGAFHLYGHVHASYEWHVTENAKRLLRKLYVRDDICSMANVGAMMTYMDYRPMTLDEIIAHM